MVILIKMMIGVLVMEVDKVADKVTNMEVDKVTMMADQPMMNLHTTQLIIVSNH